MRPKKITPTQRNSDVPANTFAESGVSSSGSSDFYLIRHTSHIEQQNVPTGETRKSILKRKAGLSMY